MQGFKLIPFLLLSLKRTTSKNWMWQDLDIELQSLRRLKSFRSCDVVWYDVMWCVVCNCVYLRLNCVLLEMYKEVLWRPFFKNFHSYCFSRIIWIMIKAKVQKNFKTRKWKEKERETKNTKISNRHTNQKKGLLLFFGCGHVYQLLIHAMAQLAIVNKGSVNNYSFSRQGTLAKVFHSFIGRFGCVGGGKIMKII